MKILSSIFLFSFSCLIAQTDTNGNTIFNSVLTNEQELEGTLLLSNYYTLNNNIDNKFSSFYIADQPTLDEIEMAMTNYPSNFYILTKESKVIAIITFLSHPTNEIHIKTLANNADTNVSHNLIGDLTEDRANEVIRENYDNLAVVEQGKLFFNQKEFVIISNQEIEDAVISLIKKKKVYKKKASDVFLLSQKQLKDIVLKETKEGGQLDYFTEIIGSEQDGIQIKPGYFSSKLSLALYKWGRACFELGVNTLEDVFKIYSEFKQAQISERDKDFIRMGFYKEWE